MSEYKTNPSKIKVKFMDGSLATGTINSVGYDRLSTMFRTMEDDFFVLYRTTSNGSSDKVLFINKRHVMYIEPMED